MADGKAEQKGLNLEQWHKNVIECLKQNKTLKTVEDYPREKKKIIGPAAFLELTAIQFSNDDNPGTEQLAATLEAEVRIIIGYRTKDAKRTIRLLAATIAHQLENERFGLTAQPARVGGCWPDEFDTELDQYEVWRIVFTQEVLLGDSSFDDSGVVPETLYVGYSPDTGIPHEDDYQELT